MSELDRIDRMLRADVGTGVEPDPPLGGVIPTSGVSAVLVNVNIETHGDVVDLGPLGALRRNVVDIPRIQSTTLRRP